AVDCKVIPFEHVAYHASSNHSDSGRRMHLIPTHEGLQKQIHVHRMDVKKSRPRCERPRGSHTAKRRDERAPLSLPDASRAFDGKDSTSRYDIRLLRCGFSILPTPGSGQTQPSAILARPLCTTLRTQVGHLARSENGMDRPRSRPQRFSECAGGLSGKEPTMPR